MSAVTVEHALQMAQTHWAGGRLVEAETILRQILAAFPEHAGALHTLAGMALAAGRGDLGLELLGRTVAADPTDAGAHFHLGEVQHAAGRAAEAAVSYGRALAAQPNFAEAHCQLGRLRREKGEVDEALRHLERAVNLAPQWAVARRELGKALLARERLPEARRALEHALRLAPDDVETHNAYAALLSVVLEPEKSREHFARAVELAPENYHAINNLGFMCRKLGRLTEAKALMERALALQPDYASAYNNLGALYRHLGQPERALEFTRRAVALEPGSLRYGSDLVLAGYYHPGFTREDLHAELRDWNARHAEGLRPLHRPFGNDRDPERPLRVGYVSPDLCVHVISHFIIPLFELHDRTQVEIHAYASVAVPDALTARLRRAAHAWHDVRSMNDLELAERVRADGIDVLVDLSSHTADNRLRTFACRPAPVQVSWLGFAGSTGLETMDYRLTDPVMDPPGADESWSSEEPVRLPDGWCCYDPLGEAPPVAPLPALRNGYVTFGSLNNFVKVNVPTLRRWARAMRAVQGSCLLMHAAEGEPREFVRSVLAAAGIAAERVEFVGQQSGIEYLNTYHRIDVGLDPFPFNGMTTTCGALWMGVPVLSLPGEMPHSRAGASLLRAVGLGAWVAADEEDYAAKAAALTANLTRLQRVRAGLRRRVQESPLTDGPRFARHVEEAYRGMWRKWAVSGER